MTLRLVLAAGVSTAVILTAPFMGQIRAALRSTFPDSFVLIVGSAIALVVAATAIAAVLRVRRRGSPAGYIAIAGALLVAGAYSLTFATGSAEVDVVERVHFVEYGVITMLFYWAWRPARDLSALVMPVFAGLIVGTLEEWFQWFIPVRVGEARDVMLNLVAIGCGLLIGAAIDPPGLPSRVFQTTPRAAWRRMAVGAGLATIVFAAFASTVHLGYTVDDSEAGAFRSRYPAARLRALTADRAARWALQPPLTLRRLSREDQYLDEGLWHVRRRNEAWDGGDFTSAWHENLILERFFTPVLDTPTYAGRHGHRWPADQRTEARTKARMLAPYSSDAEPYPIVVMPKPLLWGAVLVVVGALSVYRVRTRGFA